MEVPALSPRPGRLLLFALRKSSLRQSLFRPGVSAIVKTFLELRLHTLIKDPAFYNIKSEARMTAFVLKQEPNT